MTFPFLDEIKNDSNTAEVLQKMSENIKDPIVFSTSFGKEDQVITHLISRLKLNNINIFTLDTGRLFPETYSVWDKTVLKYGLSIKNYSPDTKEIEDYVSNKGINAFYDSIDLRKECCFIRKVSPLKRALEGAKVWITGLRSEQSFNRKDLNMVEWDEQFQLYKFNPLLNWTAKDVSDYIQKHQVPYNNLHDNGFISIGCAPCTRAIKKGEDFRAGRWWWEKKSNKECGLHN